MLQVVDLLKILEQFDSVFRKGGGKLFAGKKVPPKNYTPALAMHSCILRRPVSGNCLRILLPILPLEDFQRERTSIANSI